MLDESGITVAPPACSNFRATSVSVPDPAIKLPNQTRQRRPDLQSSIQINEEPASEKLPASICDESTDTSKNGTASSGTDSESDDDEDKGPKEDQDNCEASGLGSFSYYLMFFSYLFHCYVF